MHDAYRARLLWRRRCAVVSKRFWVNSLATLNDVSRGFLRLTKKIPDGALIKPQSLRNPSQFIIHHVT